MIKYIWKTNKQKKYIEHKKAANETFLSTEILLKFYITARVILNV